VDELTQLSRFGVKAAEARGWMALNSGYTINDITKLHTHGVVDPRFAAAALQVIQGPEADDLIRLHEFGVTAEYLEGIKGVQGCNTPEDVIRLKTRNVTTEEIAAWRDYSPQIIVQDIIQLHTQNVSLDYARRLKGIHFSVSELLQFKTYGVTPQEAAAWRKAGFQYSAWDLAVLHASNVPYSFAAALKATGRTNMTPAAVVRLRQRGDENGGNTRRNIE
jgi:hypothetical protein